MELKNNTILITGGTSGLGFELAKKLLTLDNTVIITGRDKGKLDSVKKNLPEVHIFQSDVSNLQQINQLFQQVTQQFPKMNMLINNAGEMRKLILQDETNDLQDITREIDINLTGPIRMIQQFLPHLKKQPFAAVMNVTSGLALVPFPISPVYGASKSGLRSFTQSLRVQLKNTNVKVFELVAPAVNTPLNNKFVGMDGLDLKSMMEPDKVIGAVIEGLQKDTYEIYPGAAKIIRLMSRLAPKFLLSQTSKAGAKLMAP